MELWRIKHVRKEGVMLDTCHECGEDVTVRERVMGVVAGQTPNYKSNKLVWSELAGAEIVLLFHVECMEKMWLQKTEEVLPVTHSHDSPLPHEKQPH